MGRLPLVSLALVALTAAGGGFLLPPQEDEGEWDDEGKGDWIADLLSAADSAAQVGRGASIEG